MDEAILVKVSEFEEYSCHKFKDRELLLAALIRPCFLNEHPTIPVVIKQEALSNIGDAVIDLLATEHLVRLRRLEDKGKITDERQKMVNGEELNEVAAPIISFMSMSCGEMNDLSSSRIRGECLEAVVGALYLDGGLSAAKLLLCQLGFFKKDR